MNGKPGENLTNDPILSNEGGSLGRADTRAFARRSLHKIDFNLLVPLQALLMEVNVTHAAERTKVSQPTMSASLGRLRRHFNDPLLVRDGRSLKLTPFAVSLLDSVNKALDAMYSAMDKNAAFDSSSLRRTFTIITSDYVTIVLLKPLLKAVIKTVPNLRLDIMPPSQSMRSSLRRIECDLLIGPHSLVPEDVRTYQNRYLFTDRFVVVADKDNPAVGDSLSMEELTQLPYIDAMRDVKPSELWDVETLDKASFVNLSTKTGYFTTPMHLVAGTPMVTLTQARLFNLFGPSWGLRAVPLRYELPSVVETMYWHSKHTADPAHIWLREKLSEVAASLEATVDR